jgi:hypothetical protein
MSANRATLRSIYYGRYAPPHVHEVKKGLATACGSPRAEERMDLGTGDRGDRGYG